MVVQSIRQSTNKITSELYRLQRKQYKSNIDEKKGRVSNMQTEKISLRKSFEQTPK